MKASFLAAGFDEQRCRYSVFDNSQGSAYDPYQVLAKVSAATPEPYLILCHQDVLLNQGHGLPRLRDALEELSRKDPRWAVAGNAGCTDNTLKGAIKITDPHGTYAVGKLPRRVQSLDENFLILKTGAALDYSSELTGFHLYGTDLCLTAIRQGCSCYVIDFHLTHLSGGSPDHRYYEALAALQRKWSRHFAFCYVNTTCTLDSAVFLSKYAVLRRLFGTDRAIRFVVSHPQAYRALVSLRRFLQGKAI